MIDRKERNMAATKSVAPLSKEASERRDKEITERLKASNNKKDKKVKIK